MSYNLKYSQYNERSILVEWPAIIDESILKSILSFKRNIQDKYIKSKVEIINTYSSILIIYDVAIDNINDKILELKALFKTQKSNAALSSKTWEIPVCYDGEFGIDLEGFSKAKSLSKKDVISLHTKTDYTVFFAGFLPGFLYLGGLDKRLHLHRKITPSLHVRKGSVAIGGNQTGIYPQDSPGGWHVIGKTPIELFNAFQNPPSQISAFDKLKFIEINKSEYFDLEKQIATASFQLKPIIPNA